MKDILINVTRDNSYVYPDKKVLGISGENLQGNIIFELDSFVDGFGFVEIEYEYIHHYEYICSSSETGEYEIKGLSKKFEMANIESGNRLLYYPILNKLFKETLEGTEEILIVDGSSENKLEFEAKEKVYYELVKDEVKKQYYMPIYNTLLLKEGRVYLQLRIDEQDSDLPIFKGNKFYLDINEAINAISLDKPKEYDSWISRLEEAINETNNLNIDANRVEDGVKVVLTKKDGTQKEVMVNDGESGTKDYEELENKPSINNVELIGDKSLEDLGIDQDFVKDDNYVHTDNNFTNTYKNKITTNESNITTLTSAVEEHDQSIQNIENDIDELQTDVEDLGTAVDNLDVNKQNKLTAGANITIDANNVISATGGSGGIVVDIGSYQYTYESYVLPAIAVTKAREIYATDKLGTPQVLLWTLYGNESQFKVVSSDEIAGTYSFDILVHNKYPCAYSWDDDTTGILNPTVQAGGEGGNVDDVQINGTSIVENKVANIPITGNNKTGLCQANTVNAIQANESGSLSAVVKTYEQYQSGGPTNFISKGTLENVITGKELVNQTQLDTKQNIQSNNLQTSNKNIVPAINELKGRIDNLQNIGRFLAIWDCSTGLPTSEPSEMPYEYKTGDYFRVGVVDEITNYMPNGSSYNGTASTTEFTGEGLSLGAVFYYDGTLWRLQASGGGGTVQDVQVNGTTILSGGIANVQSDASSITLDANNKFQTVGVVDNKTSNTDKFWTGTLAEYNALATKDNNTFYNITDDNVDNGIPSGGTTGQVLKKASGTDYDVEWGTGGAEVATTTTTSDSIGYACNYVNGRVNGVVLWTNSNPSSSIITQTITVDDMSDYDIIDVWFRQWRTDDRLTVNRFRKSNDAYECSFFGAGNGYYIMRQRSIIKNSNTSLTIKQGYQVVTGKLSSSDEIVIPYKIIGYKDSAI